MNQLIEKYANSPVIKFNAYFELGENKEITGMLENVIFYPGGKMAGCNLVQFRNKIISSDYEFDGLMFCKKSNNYEQSLSEIKIPYYAWGIMLNGLVIILPAIPLQYSGLNDMDGKELYNHDIILETTEGGYKGYSEITFRDGAFWDDGDLLLKDTHKQCRKVGNIFQHPELLALTKA